MQPMTSDHEAASQADPEFEQHFLVSNDKLSRLIAAAEIRPNDQVVEVGAGIGTVARAIPEFASLTVIELDDRLIGFLRQNVPRARVIQGDALSLLEEMPCDVLIGNLPNLVTENLLRLLPRLSFRTAVLAVGESSELAQLSPEFAWSEVTRIAGDDFLPPQPTVSRIVRITRSE